jgi:hypothetical protein
MAEPGLIRVRMREREGLIRWIEERRNRGSLLFAELLRTIAEDDDLFALSLEAMPGQMSARVLLAAVHFLLLKNPDHPLAAYFPTLAAEPLPPHEAEPAFRAFCKEHRDELAEITRSRTLQTTFIERSVQILLALDEVAKAVGGPFSLVEVGCSAGLLLLFDQYRYNFPAGGCLGREDAEVTVSSFEFIGPQPAIPAAFPRIVRRVGLDLDPVDVADPDARNWILACASAEWVDHFDNLRRALDYRARTPLEVVAGDALETLPKLLDELAGPVCVLHSRCLYQWPEEAQSAFTALLKRLSRTRTIHRIGIERSNAEIAARDITGGGLNEIQHSIYRDGEGASRLLGTVRVKDRIEWFA